jgi:hypothetical protein
MHRLLWIVFALVLSASLAAADDGTLEGAASGSEVPQGEVGGVISAGDNIYVLTPIESVSINDTQTWQDNRHRAYWSDGLLNVNGFLLFDVSDIPDDECVVGMSLLCYLENAYGSPAYNPVVDVYYSEDDGWTRASATPGSLSLDVLLVDDVPFSVYVPTYTFVFDISGHDWSQDLADNQICIGFTNDVNYYSYVYFFGAYGDPQGPPPELTIETMAGSPADVTTWGAIKAFYR